MLLEYAIQFCLGPPILLLPKSCRSTMFGLKVTCLGGSLFGALIIWLAKLFLFSCSICEKSLTGFLGGRVLRYSGVRVFDV